MASNTPIALLASQWLFIHLFIFLLPALNSKSYGRARPSYAIGRSF